MCEWSGMDSLMGMMEKGLSGNVDLVGEIIRTCFILVEFNYGIMRYYALFYTKMKIVYMIILFNKKKFHLF